MKTREITTSYLILMGLGLALIVAQYKSPKPIKSIKIDSMLGLEERNFQSTENIVTFEDVRGISECRNELLEVVDILQNRSKYQKMGARLPKGLLLTGEPGTGKTLLARAIAGEAGVSFFYCSGSDLEEVFVGVGARRVRELFAQARKQTPSIIFIDEIDTIGSSRKNKGMVLDTHRATLNQLLVEMDGFSETENILVIGATNTPEDIDHALVRPGRLDKEIAIPIPNIADRLEIIQLYLDKVHYDKSIDIQNIAKITSGFTGADIANLINNAILIAVKEDRSACNDQDIDKAKDRITMGIASPHFFRTEKEKYQIALREIAKSLTILWTPGTYQLYKTSILRRGNVDGKTVSSPSKDEISFTKEQALANIDVLVSAKVCEDLFFEKEEVTEHPAEDLGKATATIVRFLMQGMFEETVGLLFFREMEELGSDLKEKVDKEASEILKQSYKRVHKLISPQFKLIKLLAEELVEKETLTREELTSLISKYNR